MSDEELYRLAASELNSSKRRSDIWSRAVAIASDDHEEARYLYTRLRVDQLRQEAAQSTMLADEHHKPVVETLDTDLRSELPPPSNVVLKRNLDTDAANDNEQDATLKLDHPPLLDTPESAETLDVAEPNNLTLELQAETPEQARLQSAESTSAPGNQAPIDLADHDSTIVQDIASTPPSIRQTSRTYQVFTHDDGRARAVKQGVNWPALLFTIPWLFVKRLWGTLLVYLLMLVVLSLTAIALLREYQANGGLETPMALFAGGCGLLALAGLLYLPWRHGNRWVARKLSRKGYNAAGSINARSAYDALYHFEH